MYLKEICFKVLTIFEKITKRKDGDTKSLAIAWERVQNALEVIDKWLTGGNELDVKFSRTDVCR